MTFRSRRKLLGLTALAIGFAAPPLAAAELGAPDAGAASPEGGAPEAVPVRAASAPVAAEGGTVRDEEPPPGAPVTVKESPKEPNEKNAKRGGDLDVKGRVIARAEFTHRSESARGTFDLSVPSARLGVEYRAPLRWLRAELEADFSGRPELKDAFAEAKPRLFVVRVGQFKMPISELETRSIWALPVADRGFVHDLLVDWLDVGGRRPGLLVGVRSGGGVRVRAYAGAFEGSVLVQQNPGDRDTEFLFEQGPEVRDGVGSTLPSVLGRVELESGSTQVGVMYEHRVASTELFSVEHQWTAGADLAVDWEAAFGGLRLWVDGFSGKSGHVHVGRDPGAEAVFLSGRVLIAYRVGGAERDDFYFEPFAYGGLFDPDLEVTTDLAREIALGINVGWWRRARLTLEGRSVATDRNFPLGSQGYFYGQDPDRLGVLLQTGVAF